ncbi:sugar-binding domain-containing protein [Schaalia sp. ZJ1691]|uniref:sugar-binding transcriptional regulator n=1 Tax=Schaalia sp. ZJ1691 TaxID=2709404 RepID=UPI0013ECA698|nr:sugar-binding domain-containing protein [Schaalia sp. ZJ1691]
MKQPSRPATPDRAAIRQMAEVSRLHYVENLSKVEISERLSMSRFKVARLLDEAQRSGIVKITIQYPFNEDLTIHRDLAQHLGIEHAILVPSNQDITIERDLLGKAAADYFAEIMDEGYRVGISWGRTVAPIVRHLPELPPMEFVQISGVVGNDPSLSPVQILAKLSSHEHLTTKAVFAPLLANSSEAADSLKNEPSVSATLSVYQNLDVAFLSVGSWSPSINQLEPYIFEDEILELNEKGAVAEIGGLFFDQAGQMIDTTLNARRISITFDELKHCPHVIAVAGQLGKTAAIRAICASGLVNCLVTTDEVGYALLHDTP